MPRSRTPKRWWTYRGGWENQFLLNSRPVPLLTSVIAAYILARFAPAPTLTVITAAAERLPGALLAIIGFVLTALAIMASAEGESIAGKLREKNPDAWQGIVNHFSLTAKAAALLALALALIPVTWPSLFVLKPNTQAIGVFFLAAFVVWVAQLILASLILLERGVTKHPAADHTK